MPYIIGLNSNFRLTDIDDMEEADRQWFAHIGLTVPSAVSAYPLLDCLAHPPPQLILHHTHTPAYHASPTHHQRAVVFFVPCTLVSS